MAKPARVDPRIEAFLVAAGLAAAGERQRWTPLSGGVSSDVWRVDVGGRALCVKQALAKLKVAADWRAPIERSLYEWRWFEVACGIFPESVPAPLAADHQLGAFAMSYLDEARHPVWKALLLRGEVQIATAEAVGDRLGFIHGATASRPDLARLFPTDDLFHALRLEPYLLAAAERAPAVAEPLRALAGRTMAHHTALVHGDVSPKNILVGPNGPLFLDAECAWYGDPAFDLAFCLNHLLLKVLVVSDGAPALLASFDALTKAYLARVDWERRAALEARAASLLPGLMLARIDGKSPVEYLTEPFQREAVRSVATPLLLAPPATLFAVRDAWRACFVGDEPPAMTSEPNPNEDDSPLRS